MAEFLSSIENSASEETLHVVVEQTWPTAERDDLRRIDFLRKLSSKAQQISKQQAAWLAVVLPSPRRYQRGRLTPYVAGRVDTILGRMGSAQIP